MTLPCSLTIEHRSLPELPPDSLHPDRVAAFKGNRLAVVLPYETYREGDCPSGRHLYPPTQKTTGYARG